MSPRGFKGSACIFCGGQSSPNGEHVVPRWFVRAFFGPERGPYRRRLGGAYQRDRSGDVRETSHIDRHHVPCCDDQTGNGCNQVLQRAFELPAIAAVKEFFRPWNESQRRGPSVAIGDAAQWELTVRWLLKTALLLAHPDRERRGDLSGGTERMGAGAVTLPPSAYRWLVASPSTIPDDLSLWLAFVPRRRGESSARPTADERLMLPTILCGDQRLQSGSSQRGLCDLEWHLVYHPGCRVRSPLLRADGAAVYAGTVSRGSRRIPVLDDDQAARFRHAVGAGFTVRLVDEALARGPLLVESGFPPRVGGPAAEGAVFGA